MTIDVHDLAQAPARATPVLIETDSGPRFFAQFMPIRSTVEEESEHRRVPLMISSEQAYYWSTHWQEGELEAESDLQASRSRIFDSGRAAASWLLAVDD